MRLTTEKFIEKANSVHNGKYVYTNVEYVNCSTKVCIICPEHGEFWQTPNNHMNGCGCPGCKKETLSQIKKKTPAQFLKEAKRIHHDKYDFSKAEYVDSATKVTVICPIHGEFKIRPNDILKGVGCSKCAGVSPLTTKEFITKAVSLHGNVYDYSKVHYTNNRTKVCIICPEHGEFFQTPHNHLGGQGCPLCGVEKRTKNITYTNEEFIKKAKSVHGNKYDYSKTNVNEGKHVVVTCPIHGDFVQKKQEHLQGCGCQRCGLTISKGENEIYQYIHDNIDNNVKKRIKSVLPKTELDIYSEYYNIAVEFDGILWHSEKFRPNKKYHLDKTNQCKDKGIRLLHVFEDEWAERKEIVLSMIDNIFGKTNHKIYARKCEVLKVSPKEKNEFLEKNHIQGKCRSTHSYGLYYNGELVSLMTFGKLRQQKKYNSDYDSAWEMLRFCNKLNTVVVGGASRLLTRFIKDERPTRIVTYADKRWSQGNLYLKLGFEHKHDSRPNYFYVVGKKRKSRFNFRKGELIKQGFDASKSEHDIMLGRKIYRVYDCGSMVFEKRIKW